MRISKLARVNRIHGTRGTKKVEDNFKFKLSAPAGI